MAGTVTPCAGVRPWKAALGWLLFLGPFFFATYGLANGITGLRAHVPVVVFDWERHIPFLAWTIVPYWAIDLLYAASLFVCASRAELHVHVRRLLAAQIIAVTCFLLLPLRFSFERPEAGGMFGWMFDLLESFDQPFNQAPSLHIALLVILWSVYLRAVPRAWHPVLHAGFALIGVSVLTTWQHHFIDIPTGAWLGWFCVWLFPDGGRNAPVQPTPSSAARRRTLALRYALIAFGVGVGSIAAGDAWLWLLWIAGSLALVALIYALGDAAGFRKRADGSIAPAACWLLGPYFAGAWLNARWWTRRAAQPDMVVPGILLGRVPTAAACRRLGIAAIVDLSAELPCRVQGVHYVNLPMLDLVAPSTLQLERAAAAIDAARARGPLLVCCALGYARSAAAVAAWLVRSRVAPSIDAALATVRAARPGVVLGAAHLDALRQWQAVKIAV